MKNYILINGALDERFSHESLISNRSFRYGDGLFETIRIYNGRPLFAELHYKRITEGLKLLNIKNEETDNFILFENNLFEIIKANNINKGGRVRYSIFRASGGLYKPESFKGISIVEGQSKEDNLYKLNGQGVLIKLYEDILKPINILSPLKNPFALIHVMSGLSNTGDNYESVLLNDQKKLCESTSSNIFFLKNNILYTPSLNQGCVEGIMRFVVINYLSKLIDIEVVETETDKSILKEADEVFFTNAIQGIKWALGYENKRYYNKFSKMLTQRLNDFIF